MSPLFSAILFFPRLFFQPGAHPPARADADFPCIFCGFRKKWFSVYFYGFTRLLNIKPLNRVSRFFLRNHEFMMQVSAWTCTSAYEWLSGETGGSQKSKVFFMLNTRFERSHLRASPALKEAMTSASPTFTMRTCYLSFVHHFVILDFNAFFLAYLHTNWWHSFKFPHFRPLGSGYESPSLSPSNSSIFFCRGNFFIRLLCLRFRSPDSLLSASRSRLLFTPCRSC